MTETPYETILSTTDGPVATITLNRPEQLNTIVPPLPDHAYERMGLASTQTLGPILDGLMRNTREARAFIERADRECVRAAVSERDGPFGDYSQAPPERRPNPHN